MDSPAFFCATCGAANPAEIGTCFACGQNLAVVTAPGFVDTHSHAGSLFPGVMLKARYQILQQVGSGGFGAVYKAKDTGAHGKLVAIKEINLQGLTPQEVIEATDTFNREIAVLSGLNHKALPNLSDHFTDPEHWYLVMDFIDGETLEEFVQQTRSGTLPLEDVLDIGIQLCTVLEYLHSRQPPVIFRDLKPANIMRTLSGHLYLIDFGIARYLKPGQARDTIALGSPGFAAPEQYGKAQTTQQSDIYSLGVTLHTLLTGNDPADNPFLLPALHSMNASLPTELVALLEQMLALNVDQRPQSVTVVKQQLQRIAMRQFRASYPLTPAQLSTNMPQATTVTAKSLKHAYGSKASVQRTVMNVVVTGLALLIVVGSCGFGSYIFSNGMVRSRSEPPSIAGLPAAHQVMRMPVIGSANALTLDPALANDTQSSNAVSMLYTGLMSLDDNLRVSPQLAASWAVSADGLSWTFHLRPNLMFSDKSLLTSADVAYSIDRALQAATQSPTSMTYLGLLKDADALHSGRIATIISDSIFTPDPQTVVILLRKPAPYFATLLAYPCAYVVEKSLLEQYGNKKFTAHLTEGGGAGPFKMAINTPGKEVDFVINAHYYGPLPQLSRIIFTFYRSVEDSYQAYLAGQLDTTLIPQSLNYDMRARPDFRQLYQLMTHYYTMNYLEKPFDNVHIRQAFALAINKDILLRVSQNSQLPPAYATNHIIPMHFEGFNSGLNGPDGSGTTGDAS
nr:ABC transporter substrate-binding protein [Ktedonobacteraceae bacterium]